MDNMRVAYDEVYVYTMGRPGFILQHVVDAFMAQTADADTKSIGGVFSLAGLISASKNGFQAVKFKRST
jgi:hypothetical protein